MLILQVLQVCTSPMKASLSWGGSGLRVGGADDISPSNSIHYIHLVLLGLLLQNVIWFTRSCFFYCPPQYGQISTSRAKALCFCCGWLLSQLLSAHKMHIDSFALQVSMYSQLLLFRSLLFPFILLHFILFCTYLVLHSQYLLSSTSFTAICWDWCRFLHMVPWLYLIRLNVIAASLVGLITLQTFKSNYP